MKGKNTNVGATATTGESGTNNGTEKETKTFDDILKNKKYQSEFDRRVQKAIATHDEKMCKNKNVGYLEQKDEIFTEVNVYNLDSQINKKNIDYQIVRRTKIKKIRRVCK